jgi:hypothetical protein
MFSIFLARFDIPTVTTSVRFQRPLVVYNENGKEIGNCPIDWHVPDPGPNLRYVPVSSEVRIPVGNIFGTVITLKMTVTRAGDA